jgi:hypothetical protein
MLAKFLLASVVLALPLAAAAQPPAQPLDQARESVGRNLEKDPENPGLTKAAQRLQENQDRFAARERPSKPERFERPMRPERPMKPERPFR